MKKILPVIFTLILIFATNQVYAFSLFGNASFEEKVQKKCGTKLNNLKQTNYIDDEIIATECVYKVAKKEKVNTSPLTESLYGLYLTKYNNSAQNQEYFNKLYKYSVLALKDGVRDKTLAKTVIYCAGANGNINYYNPNADIQNIDRAYELLTQLDKKEAEKMKKTVIDIKNAKNKQIQEFQVQAQMARAQNQTVTQQKSNECNDYFSGQIFDPVLGPTSICERDKLIKSGQYNQLKNQQDQTKTLKQINNSVQNIDSSLQRLNW